MGGLDGGGGELLVGGLVGGLDCCGGGDAGMVGGLVGDEGGWLFGRYIGGVVGVLEGGGG
jgi:hypothetical protein